MHPAKSVIFFTTLSGAGFGLLMWLSLILALGHAGDQVGTHAAVHADTHAMPQVITHALAQAVWGIDMFILSFLAIGFSSIGLIASTFHLGNPQRAWRAFSQWRSSWLSREGVLSVATLGLFSLWLASAFFGLSVPSFFGWFMVCLSLATIFATAMIYAQLRPVPRWHTPLTPSCYVSFGILSGLILMTSLHSKNASVLYLVLLWLVIAWGLKLCWWYRADRTGRSAGGSTISTAMGLSGFAEIRLFEKPHLTRNYLMKEMVFQVGRKHVRRLRQLAFISGGLIPFILFGFILYTNTAPIVLITPAILFHFGGLFIERWLFFAEAEHVVGLYYGQT